MQTFKKLPIASPNKNVNIFIMEYDMMCVLVVSFRTSDTSMNLIFFYHLIFVNIM